MGNGITICDHNRKEYCDYKTVEHIGYNRNIYYSDKNMSKEAVANIESFTKYNNLSASLT